MEPLCLCPQQSAKFCGSGEILDTIADIGFIAYDVADIVRTVVKGEGVSGTQVASLGADVLGAVVPFATGGGLAVRAAAKADDIVDGARALDKAASAGGAASRLLPAVTETAVQRLGAEAAEKGLTLSRHAIERLAVREADISLTAVQRTIQRGQKFFDPKNSSIVSVLDRGMASGDAILVARNPGTGLITTVLTGQKLVRSRFVPIP